MDKREMRALTIAATTRLAPDNGCWKVPSQTGEGTYRVVVTGAGSWSCTCPDHEERLADCKHIMAVEITVQREAGKQKVTYTEMVKVTYSQNWSAYNAVQTGEKEMFLRLLAELCSTIPQPPQAIGRPRLPLSDMAFAVVSKVYARFSARRFASDLRTAEAAGLVDKAPSFNSVLRYMRSPEVTPVLSRLVEVSSLPLKAVETDFAVDSTGFGTSQRRSWYSQKHGRVIESRDWRKVHAMAGVRTHIVTAVEVGPYASGDAPYLPGLAATTAANFPMREVSADKGYLTKNNAAAVERLGATPYIPFKSNSVEPAVQTKSTHCRLHRTPRRLRIVALRVAGYLDMVPIFSVYPRTIRLEASCTLKRLQFRSWDPHRTRPPPSHLWCRIASCTRTEGKRRFLVQSPLGDEIPLPEGVNPGEQVSRTSASPAW